MTTEQALLILQKTIADDLRHTDYDRVVELAEWYHKVITGKDINTLLRRFVRREDPVMFEQRELMTVAITPAVSETLVTPFYRVGRLENVRKQLTYPDGQSGADKKLEELNNRIAAFWGKESLDKYLATRFIQLGSTDPNAWLAVEFSAFDGRYEKARPYPTEFSAKEAIHFEIINNETQWLIVRKAHVVEKNKIKKPGFRYLMYLPNDVLVYTPYYDDAEFTTEQVKPNAAFTETGIEFWLNQGQKYTLTQYQPKGGMVQAMRVGYKLDMETNGRTFVNPFHAAKPYFEKSIKAVSELDLSVALHVHPQKIQRVEPCPGEGFLTCNSGKDPNGGTCQACGGTGKKTVVSTTAQDIIEVDFPKSNALKGDVVALNDIVTYVNGTPIDVLKFLDDYIDKLEIKAIKAVYNSDVISKTTIAQTATERIENKDEMYNTLQPFAEHFSTVWKHVVRLIAAFTDNGEGLNLVHEFPADFKLKTVNELLGDLKHAQDSGASAFVIQEIEKDIASKLYVDDETQFRKYKVKTRFTPFIGKEVEDIKWIFETGRATKEEEILWTHSDTIFDELENEVPGFFLFTYDKQWLQIKRKVEEIQAKLPKEAIAIPFRNTDSEDLETLNLNTVVA